MRRDMAHREPLVRWPDGDTYETEPWTLREVARAVAAFLILMFGIITIAFAASLGG